MEKTWLYLGNIKSEQKTNCGHFARATSSMIDPVKKMIPIKMEDVAESQSFPYSCTEARHSIVHGQMPSLPHLRIVASQCLDFLRTGFWYDMMCYLFHSILFLKYPQKLFAADWVINVYQTVRLPCLSISLVVINCSDC